MANSYLTNIRVQTNLENQGKPGKVVIFKVFQGVSGKLGERF